MVLPSRIVCLYTFVWATCWTLMVAFYNFWPIYFLLWPGLSFTLVLIAYWTNKPELLGKNPKTGKLHKGILILLFPFFALVWCAWYIESTRSNEPVYSNVANNLYLGRYSRTIQGLDLHSDCLVLDMTSEFSEPDEIIHNTNYRCFPVLDGHYPGNHDEYIELANEALKWQGPVYVHCAQGHGRSGAVLVILVILRGHVHSIDEAIAFLRQSRPGVDLHPYQRNIVEKIIDVSKDKNLLYL
jgi:hypothetical protein